MSSDLATLKLKVDVQRRLIAMLSLRRVRQTFDAARLLAHQQALTVRLTGAGAVLADENERLRVKIEHLHAQLYEEREVADRTDAAAEDLRAEFARKDAEIERLRKLLGEVVHAWAWEARQGDGIDERHSDLWERANCALGASGIAIGDEREGGAA